MSRASSAVAPDRTTEPLDPKAGPASPARLGRRGLWTVAKRTVREFNGDNAWDWAAALTYYGVLSIFPGLLVLVSVVGLLHRSVANSLVSSLSQLAPGPVRTLISGAVNGLQQSSSKAGLVAIIGLVLALWSASGYAAAFIRAANAVYDVPEGRPAWKVLPIRLGVTVATGLLLVVSAAIVIVSGNLATVVGRALGLQSATVATWNVVKWPVLIILIGVLFAVLYWASPNARQGGVRWVSPGGLLAVLLWTAASVGFGFYVANFGSYDKTYGTLAGVVVFLIWLWISNLSLLLGLEFNAELERQRATEAGLPPGTEPYVQLRDDRAVRSGAAATTLADRAFDATPTGATPTGTTPTPATRAESTVDGPPPVAGPASGTAGRVPIAAAAFVAGAFVTWRIVGRERRR